MSKEESAVWNPTGQEVCGNITLELQDKAEEHIYYIHFTANYYEASSRKLSCSGEVISELHTHREVSKHMYMSFAQEGIIFLLPKNRVKNTALFVTGI